VKVCEHKVQGNRLESVFLRLLEAATCAIDATINRRFSAVDVSPLTSSEELILLVTSLRRAEVTGSLYGTNSVSAKMVESGTRVDDSPPPASGGLILSITSLWNEEGSGSLYGTISRI
jgi:hypothetical protein